MRTAGSFPDTPWCGRTFLPALPRVSRRNVKSKSHPESPAAVPLWFRIVCTRACCKGIRTSEPDTGRYFPSSVLIGSQSGPGNQDGFWPVAEQRRRRVHIGNACVAHGACEFAFTPAGERAWVRSAHWQPDGVFLPGPCQRLRLKRLQAADDANGVDLTPDEGCR